MDKRRNRSTKIEAMLKLPSVKEVHRMIDTGMSAQNIVDFLKENNNFTISKPVLYKYITERKKRILQEIQVEKYMGTPDDTGNQALTVYQKQKQKLRKDLDALEIMITIGHDQMMEELNYGKTGQKISPQILMNAIALRDRLTQGNSGGLTDVGLEELKEVEKKKYELVIETLMQFIPDELKGEALEKIEEVEDAYYQTTDYYEQYLQAKGMTEQEIRKRMYDLEQMHKAYAQKNKLVKQITTLGVKLNKEVMDSVEDTRSISERLDAL